MRSVSSYFLVSAFLILGCGGPEREVTPMLSPLNSCAAVQDSIRASAIEQMTSTLIANRDRALKGVMGDCRGSYGYGYDSANGAAIPSAGGASKSSGEGASQVSKTNNQVAGVDEADFIKNDNQYIYLVSGSYLRIIRAWPAPQTHELSNVKIEGEAKKLFVKGPRALVYVHPHVPLPRPRLLYRRFTFARLTAAWSESVVPLVLMRLCLPDTCSRKG